MTKIPEEAVERMEALVRVIAKARPSAGGGAPIDTSSVEEAKVIVAMLPEPVDPLLVEAREWCAEYARNRCAPTMAKRYERGELDQSDNLRAYLAGARAQQAKLTPTTGPDGDGWIKHTPGDPMPCDGEMKVDVRTVGRPEENRGNSGQTAAYWQVGEDWWSRTIGNHITHWRPAR